MSNVGRMKRNIKKQAQYTSKEDTQPFVVNDNESVYYSPAAVTFSPRSAHHLIQQSRHGLPVFKIESYMNKYGLTLKEIAAILNLSERTLQRYDSSDVLSKESSDRALHLQRLYERGEDVFGSLDKFKRWMKSPILAFNNNNPITYLDTIFGFELIEQELGRIEYGIFA